MSQGILLCQSRKLINQKLFRQLEELKPLYVDEPERKKKDIYKRQIEDTINILTNGKEAFDFEIYFSEVFHRKSGFDVVIANPPYGADIDDILYKLRPLYLEATRNYAEIYKMFMQLGLRMVRKDGIQL